MSLHRPQVAAKCSSGASGADLLAFPMCDRCLLLRALLAREAAGELLSRCHVLEYEHSCGGSLLEPSPGYWVPLPPARRNVVASRCRVPFATWRASTGGRPVARSCRWQRRPAGGPIPSIRDLMPVASSAASFLSEVIFWNRAKQS